MQSYAYQGGPGSWVPQFNPNVFPTELRARAWPAMMAHIPTPAASPVAGAPPPPQSADHASTMDESELTTTAMYSAVNKPDGSYRGALIMPNSYVVSMEIPTRDPNDAIAPRQRQGYGHSYSSAAYVMTVAMLNHYMRAQHTKLRGDPTLDGIARQLRQQGQTDQGYLEALEKLNSLSLNNKHILHFENPVAAAATFRCLGTVVSQPNPMMSAVNGEVQSSTANAGLTQFSVATGGVPKLRNYWGRHGLITGKRLWFVLMRAAATQSYVECVRTINISRKELDGYVWTADYLMQDQDRAAPPQLVPWCSNDKTGTQTKNGITTNTYASETVDLPEVSETNYPKTVPYFVGMTLSTTKTYFDAQQSLYAKIACLSDIDDKTRGLEGTPDLSEGAILQGRVPALDVMLAEKRGGSLLRFY